MLPFGTGCVRRRRRKPFVIAAFLVLQRAPGRLASALERAERSSPGRGVLLGTGASGSVTPRISV